MTTPTNLEAFIAHVQSVMDKERKGIDVTVQIHSTGPKYVRVTTVDGQESVYAFIDKATGDILKPASWKAPAKHARGNINNPATWTCAGPWGIAYLR